MSKIRKLIGFASALAFVIAMLPALAFAETTQYNLFVNGEQFTSDNLTIACGEGTATYDPDAQTLTLNNASITNTLGYGGINSQLTGDLDIVLQGENRITFDDNMGIMAKGNVEFSGSGSLTINVAGETKDGISAAGNVSVRATTLIVNAPGGVGIASDGSVVLDNARLTSHALYAGIDAVNLTIRNGSVVDILATENNCNAAFISSRGDPVGGNLSISNSSVVAKSLSPGLFASGNLTIDGGSVQSTSTKNSGLWARGDLTIKGGAKVALTGAYPAGCGGNFTVYAAEIDAKNTNTDNIPALFDSLVINADFDLTHAVAVDSEGTTIDLIEHDGAEQAKGFLHLYKNIHFTTGEKSVSYSFPFTKVVKKGGDIAPGKQEFELEIFNVGVGQIEDYAGVTVTASVVTDGEKKYEGLLTIKGPKSQVRDVTCEGFCVREKNTGVANWTYSDAVYQIFCHEYTIVADAQSATQSSYEIFPVKLVETDNGAFYEKTQDTPVTSMTFENVYTEKTAPAEGDKPDTGKKPADTTKPAGKKKTTAGKIPSTGDSNTLAMECAALLAIAGVLAVGLSMKKLRGGRNAR
ncbi:carbohydrate-binding domain-containing protein [Collinsella sp. KGMB02528]|uniref:Carbohydrate-binding domain-containing protein n=1 Tax=Collinsella acetigenes TaxID=2713419 RepID=A0A7X9UDK2_9ACTN|nr:carbohydrate-binding domain-containing protein [Collinsella acetigenes]NMF56413.1 carbohydrate-binding domain-containing protein [Collinsella acetigenes]